MPQSCANAGDGDGRSRSTSPNTIIGRVCRNTRKFSCAGRAKPRNYRAERLKAGRAELGLSYGDTPRQTVDLLLPDAGRERPARHVRSRRLVAFAGSLKLQPDGARLECPRDRRCGRGLRSVSQYHDRRHHRANPPGLRVSMAAPTTSPAGLRTFGRRPSRFRDGGDRLALALSRRRQPIWCPAGYAISGVFDLAPLVGISVNQDLRLDAAEARRVSTAFWQPRARSDVRCRRWRTRIRRVQAPKQISCRYLAAGRRANAL